MDTLDRILSLINSKGITGKEFTEKLGLNKSVISDWKSGKTKSYEKYIGEIADFLDISADYLLTGKKGNVDLSSMRKFEIDDFEPIPVVGRVSAGYGYFVGATTNIEEYELASAELLRTGYEYCYIIVDGDSMEPIFFEDDLVLIQERQDVYDGDYVIAIIDNDEGIIKQFHEIKNGFELISKNPYYPTRKFIKEDTERVHIVGKVIEVKRKLL